MQALLSRADDLKFNLSAREPKRMTSVVFFSSPFGKTAVVYPRLQEA